MSLGASIPSEHTEQSPPAAETTTASAASRCDQGLSTAEAEARLKVDGPNELPSQERRSTLAVAFAIVREPMMLLLLGAGLVYLALGDPTEATVLLLFATVSVVITVVQEIRTEKVLAALSDLSSPRALVIRDGGRKRIPGREVVRGDVIVLEEGSRIAADGVLADSHALQVDESLLTGESVAVPKHHPADKVYSGTLAIRGKGLAVVTATGRASRIGQIGSTLAGVKREPPRLQAETRRLTRVFGTGAVALCVGAVALYGLVRGDWLHAILSGIALAMSMLPEEFPVVLTVFTAMGAWRISRARVLTRNAAAIETLGAATVLCSDKTGTLTENRMSIVSLHLDDGQAWQPAVTSAPPSDALRQLALVGRLASDKEPYDPMELAFHRLAARLEPEAPAAKLERAYPLMPELMAMTQVWQQEGAERIAAAKGAPEAIAELCRLDEMARWRVMADADAMAHQGLRVLAVASAILPDGDLPASQRDLPLVFIGLIGLADPLRDGVAAAVTEARNAGIRVVMITGDYPVTAAAIAGQAGIDGSQILTGDELLRMDAPTLAARVRTTSVFARITPEQKLRLVDSLKANGDVVAMTGDGVNDAPSLKAAHIGIAMGGRGTDVAREASVLVLLDDDFGAIVKAIRLGRRIHDNLRKAMCFIIAVHVPIAGLAMLPLLFGFPLILGPIHIALLELVIDPICTLVFENEPDEADIMNRPPAAPKAPLIPWPLLAWGVGQGLTVFAVVAIPVLMVQSEGPAYVRGLTFASLILVLFVLTLINRSFSSSVLTAFARKNTVLMAVAAIMATAAGTIVLWPRARQSLDLAPFNLNMIAISIGSALVCLFTLEVLKRFWRTPLST